MLNPIEEAKFATLEKNCQELGVPAPSSIHIDFEVKDKDGNLIFKDKQRGHSWTRNFYNLLLSISSDCVGSGSGSHGAGVLSGKTYAASAQTRVGNGFAAQSRQSATIAGYGLMGRLNISEEGIVVGTGTTAFSAENFYLVTPIANGTGAGQLVFSAHNTPPTAVYDSTAGSEKWTVTQKRVMNNNSGGEIVIGECGIVSRSALFATSLESFLIERSVLSPTVTVPNGAQLTVTYEISMSFAAID